MWHSYWKLGPRKKMIWNMFHVWKYHFGRKIIWNIVLLYSGFAWENIMSALSLKFSLRFTQKIGLFKLIYFLNKIDVGNNRGY